MAGLSASETAAVRNWAGGRQFNWEWQYLSRFLEGLISALPVLQAHYDPKQLASEAGALGKIQSAIIGEMRDALCVPHLLGCSLVLLAVARGLERQATWHEGCRCHEHVLAGRSKIMRRRLCDFRWVSATCAMKGLRLAEMVCGHTESMLASFESVSSPALQSYLEVADGEEKAVVLLFMVRLRNRLQVILSMKFGFLRELPYTLLSAVGHIEGGVSLAEARRRTRDALAERDRDIAAGRQSSLHRVAIRPAVGADNPHAINLERFADGLDKDLNFVTVVVLRDYCLGLVRARRTEGQHSRIKVAQKKNMDGPMVVEHRLEAQGVARAVEEPGLLGILLGELEAPGLDAEVVALRMSCAGPVALAVHE